ncbi:MAG: type III pantothenate kinase [Bacteroidales bacterium]|nr:type III pantothenate kinase [Bacteroidales bacterium]
MGNLVVEIGNTAIKAAWSENTVLGKTFRYQGERRMEFILSLTEKEKPEVLTIASANYITEEEEKIFRNECGHLIILDKNHTGELLRYNLPEYLTYDRAAYIIATTYLFKNKSCTVFDFGTTLTVDFLSATGRYLGGNVSPGCRTRFKALNRYSRTLPLVDTPDIVKPEGDSIVSSVESGVISGIVFEVEGYTRLRPENIIVFTGGDAVYFAKKLKNSIFVVSNLVLMGLAIITDDYVRKNL